MSKNKTTKHTPRKPRPSELRAKAEREAAKKAKEKREAAKIFQHPLVGGTPAPTLEKRTPGRPPTERKAFDKTTMVRMFSEDYAAFETEATKIAAQTGAPVSVGAFLRMAGREYIKLREANS